MSYKVFVSYSWLNSAERRALESEIARIKSVELLLDRTYISLGEPIHQKVLEMIDLADCVVALLTEDGLQSREVRDELSRIHDRGKFIIPIVSDSTTLESLPWYLRDLNHITYNNRNFDQVVETIAHLIDSRANPLDYSKDDVPIRLKEIVDSGVRFIDIPTPILPTVPTDPTDPTVHKPSRLVSQRYIYCELKMRETNQVFVFRTSIKLPLGYVAQFLAHELLPQLRSESYEWTLIRNDKDLPGFHTFETSGIHSGDVVYLKGKHLRPEVIPALNLTDMR